MDNLSVNLNRGDMEKPLLVIIRACILLVLVTPLIVTTQPFPVEMYTFYPYIVGKALYLRLMIIIAVAFWLILIINRPAYRPTKSWLLSAFTIFLLASLLASLFGVGPTRSFWSTYERMQGMVDLIHWFAFVVVTVSVFRHVGSIKVVLKINVIISVLVALLGIAQKYGVEIPGFPYLIMDGLLRVDSTLGNPTFVGAYMMVSILISAGFLAQSLRLFPSPKDWRKGCLGDVNIIKSFIAPAPWIIAVGLNFWVMMMAGARGALFGLAAGLVFCALVYVFKDTNNRLRWLSVLVLTFILASSLLFVFAKNSSFVDRMAQSNRMIAMLSIIGTDEDSFAVRRQLINIGLESFSQRPILGWGPENFYVAYDQNVKADSFSKMAATVDQPHNKVIEELVTKGIVGFISYISIWLLIGVIYVRYLRNRLNVDWEFSLFIAAASIGYFVQNLFLFDTPSTSLQFYLLFSVAVLFEKASWPSVASDGTKQGNVGSFENFLKLSRFSPTLRNRFGMLRRGFKEAVGIWHMPEFHVPFVLALLVLLYVFLIHFPYSASHHTRMALEQQTTAFQKMYEFDLAINKFPSLGNYPRVFLFMYLSDSWDFLTNDEKKAAIYIAKNEFSNGIQAEPNNWRIYLGACRLYQSASFEYPELLQSCNEYLDVVDRLAPERIETYEARVRQYLIEGNIQAAQATLTKYLAMNPESRHLLEPLINIAFSVEINE